MAGTEQSRIRLSRESRETAIVLDLDLAGGPVRVATGIGFLDHLLTALATHAAWGLDLEAAGDLWVDDHHTAEDVALALGEALARATGGRALARFGYAYAPLDEALARAVVDLSGRPACVTDLGLEEARLGDLSGQMVSHFLSSLAMAARCAIHVDVLRGQNSHHRAEAAFKALALALGQALRPKDLGEGAQGRGLGSGDASGASTKGSVIVEALDEAAFAQRRRALEGRKGARP